MHTRLAEREGVHSHEYSIPGLDDGTQAVVSEDPYALDEMDKGDNHKRHFYYRTYYHRVCIFALGACGKGPMRGPACAWKHIEARFPKGKKRGYSQR